VLSNVPWVLRSNLYPEDGRQSIGLSCRCAYVPRRSQSSHDLARSLADECPWRIPPRADRSQPGQPNRRSAIYPQVSLGFSNETVTWPLAARVKWSTSRYMTTLPSSPRTVIEPVNVEFLLRSFRLKLPQKVAWPV
jgi:hypothetical protein